jgi:hypothetical protein
MRPRAISELFDESFRHYRRQFLLLAIVSFVVAIPGLLFGVAAGLASADIQSLATNASTSSASVDFGPYFQQLATQLAPLLLVGGLISLVASPVILGANVKAAVDVIGGRPATVGSVLGGTLARYFWLLGLIGLYVLFLIAVVVAGAILGVIVVAAHLAFLIAFIVLAAVVAAIWLGIRWALVLPVIFAENVGPIRALSRSFELTRGSWWKTVGILALLTILIGIIGAALGGVFSVLFAVVPGLSLAARQVLSQVASNLVTAVVTPIEWLTITLYYFDLRVRKEGYDLEELARQAAQGPA